MPTRQKPASQQPAPSRRKETKNALPSDSLRATASDGMEIERKFLLPTLPPEIAALRGTSIRQGYLVQDGSRSVRVRVYGRKYFLTCKEGEGLARHEVEMPVAKWQFDLLWPLTEGARVEKTRCRIRHGDRTIEIDRFAGALSPLCLAEVEFPDLEAAADYVAPDYFGEEVTGKPEYRNSFLALHGLPHHSDYDYQIGSLPYLFKGANLHVVMVTNSSQTRWIIPKGRPEPGMSRQDVARMEAVEEAGVIGNFPTGIRSQCKMKDGRTLHLYPLAVTTLLKKWPESRTRKRRIVPFEQAIKLIGDKEMADCLRRLKTRLVARRDL